ncbi:ABC transporter permease [Desulfofalx alkaliphila]|uniref:ABC transporter permease n=1 Tax=Desulfofalx alkaliphila TaxID=105483 RepID=UPI0004E1C60A|nr:ABC transporter permease [Desulfofalx alkaliphila]
MLKQTLAIMHREIFYMWRDKGLRYILLIIPLLTLALFYATYHLQVMKNIPTAIVDLDQSAASRQIVSMLEEVDNLQVVAYPESYPQLQQLIERGDAVVGVVIPENLAAHTALRRQGQVYAVVDGSNLVYATNAVSDLLRTTRTMGAELGVKSLVAQGVHIDEASNVFLGADFREEAWFNPTLNYAHFLLLALALNIWQQCCMLASCMNIIGETGRKSWYQIKMSGISKTRLFTAKSITHITVFMLMVAPIYFISFGVLKLPLAGGILPLLLLTFFFIVAVHSVGTLMSGLARNAVDASRLGMATALPSFVVSGYTWPLEAMHPFLQTAVKIVPQTWFFQGLNYLTFKDPGWEFMLPFFGALALIAVICYGAAAIVTGGPVRRLLG